MSNHYKEIYAAGLAEVNSIRQHLGKTPLTALPKGIPGDGDRCPIARALGAVFVEDRSIGFRRYSDAEALDTWITTPIELVEFISAFDDGKFPELVDEDAVCEMKEKADASHDRTCR